MPCTTLLVGKNASINGSTLIARNEDSGSGSFSAKRHIVVKPDEQPRTYHSVISHLTIALPDNPMRYTCMPQADPTIEGVWAAAGVNEANVAMTATETLTSNERVLAADPLVIYQPAKDGKEEVPGGIGEEDLVVITLPYIHSAREGVERLGMLHETYGTYEMNGIAFQDINEVWWFETIGGHNWMARRVPDDAYVVMPNQLGIDAFDFDDAYGAKQNFMCSPGLKEFVEVNHLNPSMDGSFNPRDVFGSHSDSDHVYNTPRAWYMLRYFNPNTYKWDGPDADYKPDSDNLPWMLKPEKKISIEDVKYVLSSHYQGTPFDPYAKNRDPHAPHFRPIGINRNNFLSCSEIRPDQPKEKQAVEWIAFASNVHNTFVPLYADVDVIPEYFSNTTLTPTTENFYWANRIIAALADHDYDACVQEIERYQIVTVSQARKMILDGDRTNEDNEAVNARIAAMIKDETNKLLDKVLYRASMSMRNAFARSDA